MLGSDDEHTTTRPVQSCQDHSQRIIGREFYGWFGIVHRPAVLQFTCMHNVRQYSALCRALSALLPAPRSCHSQCRQGGIVMTVLTVLIGTNLSFAVPLPPFLSHPLARCQNLRTYRSSSFSSSSARLCCTSAEAAAKSFQD